MKPICQNGGNSSNSCWVISHTYVTRLGIAKAISMNIQSAKYVENAVKCTSS